MKIARSIIILAILISMGPVFAQDVLDFRVIPQYTTGQIQVEGYMYKSRPRAGVKTKDRLARLLLPWLSSGTLAIKVNSEAKVVPIENDGGFRVSFASRIFEGKVIFSMNEKIIQRETFSFPKSVDYIIVSDIDDTILDSNVKNKVKLAFKSFFKPAEKRLPIVETPSFYQKLSSGSGIWGKPIICYLTSSPALLAKYLRLFLEVKGFPKGILLTKRSLKGGSHGEHKQSWLERLATIYPEKPFLLIGDSGEQDPEIYLQFAQKTKSPILGVIIHQRYDQPKRILQLEETKKSFASMKIPFFLWKDPQVLQAAMKSAGAFAEDQ